MLKTDLLRLLFPPKCIFCGRILSPIEPDVCNACMDEILLVRDMPPRPKGAFFDDAVAALSYEGKVRKTLHRFKFSGKQSYAAPLARVLAFTVGQADGFACDLAVPVPTNRANLRRRGYNHAALLAQALAQQLDMPYLDALEKQRETDPMFGLKAAQRRANVLGAIKLKCTPEQVVGRRVLMVDDVITTGSTLSECARILKESGAAAVLCATVAAAPMRRES